MNKFLFFCFAILLSACDNNGGYEPDIVVVKIRTFCSESTMKSRSKFVTDCLSSVADGTLITSNDNNTAMELCEKVSKSIFCYDVRQACVSVGNQEFCEICGENVSLDKLKIACEAF